MAAGKLFTNLDTAWLRMDEPENRMVINGFFRLSAALDPKRLEATLADGFAPFERFRQRVVDTRSFWSRPRWVEDERFDVKNHIEWIDLPDPAGELAQRSAIDKLLSLPLDRARPLWKVYVLAAASDPGSDRAARARGSDLRSGECLLFFRIHHCIADGVALLKVLLSMCVADRESTDPPRLRIERPWYFWALLPLTSVLFVLHFLWIAVWLLIRPKDPDTLYKGKLAPPKRIAWCEAFALADVKAVARASDCKINDVLLATVAGAMRRYAEARGKPIPAGCAVRCAVPVNLRPPSKDNQLGNFFAVVSPTLAIGQTVEQQRLSSVKRSMDRLKRSPEALVVVFTLRLMGLLGVVFQRAMLRVLASKTSVVVSNVPGPRQELSFGGRRIEDIMFWVPMAGALGIGISIFSYAGRVSVGTFVDAGLISDPKAFADALQAEFDQLKAAYGLGAPCSAGRSHEG